MTGKRENTKIYKSPDVDQGHAVIERLTKDGYKILVEAIDHSNALPIGQDWDFCYRHDDFKEVVNQEATAMLRQIKSILQCNNIEETLFNKTLQEKTELIIKGNDIILERVANNTDNLKLSTAEN